jgi:Cu+-exporting ATPase
MTTATEASSHPTQQAFSVEGMNCASCVAHVSKAASKLPGVRACDVNLARGRAVVQYDPARANPEQIATAITDAGYPSKPEPDVSSGENVEEQRLHYQMHHARSWLRRAIVGFILWFPVELTHWILRAAHVHLHGAINWMDWLSLATSTIAIVYVGSSFYKSAWGALKRGTSNMDTLIAMGATVAYLYSLIAMAGTLAGAWHAVPNLYFMEASGLLALISLGHWLEARARQSAGNAIHKLLNLAPATALRFAPAPSPWKGEGGGEGRARELDAINSQGNVARSSTPNPHPNPLPGRERGQEVEEVAVRMLEKGDRVLIRPGDRVPIDGVVIDGRSSVDESMISGESLPVTRTAGDTVIGGTINQDGALKIRVTKVGSETALAQIVRLVEQAQASKPAVQKLADQIAAIFVPTVLGIALITGIGWYIYGHAHGFDPATTWAKIAVAVCSVLIIACPCALGLAVPAALMVGTGRGAHRGILIRDIDALQKAEKIDTIVLDKTGTITRGKPSVIRVEALNGASEDEVLRLAASAEQYSEHPLAKAIIGHAKSRNIGLTDPSSFTSEAGLGVVAQIDGQQVLVGSAALLASRSTGYQPVPNANTGTSVHVARFNGTIEPLGILHIADEIKSDSVAAIDELHKMNLRTILLSGDNEAAANQIAKQVGIDDVRANVRPGGKADAIRELQNRKSQIANRKSQVVMVGDGINDAPALAQADLGIAIGSGSDIAKETGDIVLVGGSLHGIATAIRLSRATMKVIRQNLFFAFIYNVIAIPLAALGLLNPLIAAAAMALSDVTVLGNALRLRKMRID